MPSMRANRRLCLCLAVLLAALLAVPGPATAQTITEQREAAVRLARGGQMPQALAALRALLAAGREDGFVAFDLTTLLQQDGKAAEAVAVYEKAAPASPPDYALLAATRAYRDLGRYADAERLARQGMARFPQETVWPLLLSLVLSDSGQTDEARAVLALPAARRAPPVEQLMAEAYAWRRAGDAPRALALYAEAARLAPADRGIASERAGTMLGLGAPYGAELIAGPTPAIEADKAAAMVRWGKELRTDLPTTAARRHAGTDAALARLDALLAQLPPPPEAAGLRRKLRLDRLVALRDRLRLQEAVEEGDVLGRDGPLPPYAELAYADALLGIRRPEAARDAYNRVLAVSPRDVAARYGLFYAATDLEDFNTAYATIDRLVADEPVWRTYRNDPTRYGNVDRQYAEVTAAQARFYGNQLGEAWDRIVRLSDAAPADPTARLAKYQIANARGWPQLARTEGGIAASLAPDTLSARLTTIELAIAGHRYREAQRLMDELRAQYPDDPAVHRLARELDAKRRFLFEGEIKPGNSDGGGANASGRTLTTQNRLTSPPIADYWRVFALGDYANANPPEGFVQRTRLGGGLDFRTEDVTALGYVAPSWGTLARTGAGVAVDWIATDQLRLAAAADLYSWETPLRALLYGITANDVAAKATWRWHEQSMVALSASYMPFSDGNQRFAAGLTGKQRLINLPHFDLTLIGEAYASTNSLGINAPYYNPTRDLSLTGGLLAEHVLWRRYDVGLVQALQADAGLYSEYGYADSWIGTLKYEHRWRFDPLTELRYGVLLTRRVYDGSVENALTLLIGLTQRI